MRQTLLTLSLIHIYAGVLGPDVVEVVPLRLDLKALGVLLGVNLAVDKGKLDVEMCIRDRCRASGVW